MTTLLLQTIVSNFLLKDSALVFAEDTMETTDTFFPTNEFNAEDKIIQEQDLSKEINYFLEVRKSKTPKKLFIYKEPTSQAKGFYKLKSGQMIKLRTTRRDLLTQLRLEAKDLGYWRSFRAKALTEDIAAHFFYHWTDFNSLEPYEHPVHLSLNIPPDESTVPVYKAPENWGWADCKDKPELCEAWIDQYADVFLLDTHLMEIHNTNPKSKFIEGNWALFYKIGYIYKDSEGQTQRGTGWIPSHNASRKIDRIPMPGAGGGRYLASSYYKSDLERQKEASETFLFNSNINRKIRRNRWAPDPKKDPVASQEFRPGVALEGAIKLDFISTDQNNLEKGIDQYGLMGEIELITPLFFDLELAGTFSLVVPISDNNEDLDSAFIYTMSQWLYYTIPWDPFNIPFKLGVGAKYFTMNTGDSEYGFSSLVSLQFGLRLENEKFWAYAGVSPVNTSFKFQLGNIEYTAGGGYHLSKDAYYDGWALTGDFKKLHYTQPSGRIQLDIIQFAIGVKKHF